MIDIRMFKGDKGGGADVFFHLLVASALFGIFYAAYLILKWTFHIIVMCIAWLVAPLFDKNKNKK